MKVTEILNDVVTSSWLNFIDAVLDSDYGYLLSFNPINFGMERTAEDTVYISNDGDTLPNVSQTAYDTVNYAPLLFLLNDSIEHPLYIPPNTEIWVPNPTKIYNFLREINLNN